MRLSSWKNALIDHLKSQLFRPFKNKTVMQTLLANIWDRHEFYWKNHQTVIVMTGLKFVFILTVRVLNKIQIKQWVFCRKDIWWWPIWHFNTKLSTFIMFYWNARLKEYVQNILNKNQIFISLLALLSYSLNCFLWIRWRWFWQIILLKLIPLTMIMGPTLFPNLQTLIS